MWFAQHSGSRVALYSRQARGSATRLATAIRSRKAKGPDRASHIIDFGQILGVLAARLSGQPQERVVDTLHSASHAGVVALLTCPISIQFLAAMAIGWADTLIGSA